MSRCFPFPPPGYEKKARTDDVDLLKKEKYREKKHKKEKKDKEKKDSKENREKDRSEGKDREKKDRKEKHKDKKKDKEKDRDNVKSSTSDEKKLTGKSEGRNGEILGKKEKDREKGKNSSSNEKRFSAMFVGENGEKLGQNNPIDEETKDIKFVQELGRRISDGDRGAENQSVVEKFMVTDRKKDQAVVRLVAKDIGHWAEGKEKKGEDRRMDGQGSRDEAESSGNTMLHNLPGFDQGKFEGIPRQLEKNIERTMEGKVKIKKKEGDDKKGDKRRDKDREKKSQGKDKNRDKEKKKEEKVKGKSEQKSPEQDKFKEGEKKDHIGSHSNKMSDLSKDSDMAAAIEGNIRKRKDLEANGFFHATDIRPNKLPRPPSSHSSHPLVENGRVLEPCQTPMNVTSDRQGVASNHVVDKKKQKVNGMKEGQPVSASSLKPATAEADKVAKASMKPPHPDSKYLVQVLSVPKMDEWSDFDDQEWLLGSNETQLKKPKVGDYGVNETPQVWEEAVQIDSADICALPYVIPY